MSAAGVPPAPPSVRFSLLRFAIVACLLLAVAFFLHARGEFEVTAKAAPLQAFPTAFDAWDGMDVPIPDNIKEALGKGDFMARRFFSEQRVPVDLFIAYFPSQRTGQSIHSPKNCLPGAGWLPVESERIAVVVPGRNPVQVNRYVLGNGRARLLVYYWYQAHARTVASEYWAKFYLVADAARLNRTDGSLVRVMSPVLDNEDVTAADARVQSFIRQVTPQLDFYIPL